MHILILMSVISLTLIYDGQKRMLGSYDTSNYERRKTTPTQKSSVSKVLNECVCHISFPKKPFPQNLLRMTLSPPSSQSKRIKKKKITGGLTSPTHGDGTE